MRNLTSFTRYLTIWLLLAIQAFANDVHTKEEDQWWAFRPLGKSQPPAFNESQGKDLHPIDRWVFFYLKHHNILPNSLADRRVLIRRASFNLLGIPPNHKSVLAFENDSSPDAWVNVVSKMLDSQRYGERWARHWLDLARYAESSGFEHDYDRPSAYHFRDFVIKALNADMPYNQFVRWQLAGDEYEPNNPLAMMATGFLGAGVFPTQITANEVERVRYDAMDDMLSTTGSAMLGLTVGCARCHDHKADPISSLEYYQMLSTFTSTVRSEIELDLEPSTYENALKLFDIEHAPYVRAISEYEKNKLPSLFDSWLKEVGSLDSVRPVWQHIEFVTLDSEAGASFKQLDDGSYLVEGKNGDKDIYTMKGKVLTPDLRALRIEALAHPSLKRGGPGRADNGNFALSRIRVFAARAGEEEAEEIQLVNPRVTFEQNENNLSIASSLDKNSKSGWAVDPEFGKNHAAVFEFEESLNSFLGGILEIRMEFSVNTKHNIGRPRLSVTTHPNAGLTEEIIPSKVASLIQRLKQFRHDDQVLLPGERQTLIEWWKKSEPGWLNLFSKEQEHALKKPQPSRTKVLVCAEGFPAVRMHSQGADFFEKTYFLKRGNTDSKENVVEQGFLKALLPSGEISNAWKYVPPEGARFSGKRRAFAEWMTDTDHGAGNLLARVMVNRLWQHHFGVGLVATPNDFGVFGQKPVHPELLDWLATQLIKNQWRLKPMHQLIMTSATYQQTSHSPMVNTSNADDDLSSLVPFFPSHRRLEAEAIRDSLLAVSGRLDNEMFGPGSLDPGSSRRSIYLTVKRSKLISAMQSFDAPEPLVSQGVRPTTTVAPQALLLMNSPFVRDWAEGFAERIRGDSGKSIERFIIRAYEMALNRRPNNLELNEGTAFINAQTKRHAISGNKTPERLAQTDFAHVVLNLNEFIYVE